MTILKPPSRLSLAWAISSTIVSVFISLFFNLFTFLDLNIRCIVVIVTVIGWISIIGVSRLLDTRAREKESEMKLDVGCGTTPHGDVNCDLFIHKTLHRHSGVIEPKKIQNFVKCDANHLAFADNVFSYGYCYHVLEHEGVNPTKSVKEMIRVSKPWATIEIRVPHRMDREKFFPYRPCKTHARLFNIANLHSWLKKLGLNPITTISLWKCFPNRMFCLIRLPWEIKAVFKVMKRIRARAMKRKTQKTAY